MAPPPVLPYRVRLNDDRARPRLVAPPLCNPGFALTLHLPHGQSLTLGGPTLVMGIVNVTPDSFSDGGRFADVEAAVFHGVRLVDEGAAILDVGGELTRPTAEPVAADVEKARVLPVVAALAAGVAAPISIDTYKASVAAAAIEAGASIVNDVWGFQRDADMARVVAATGAAAVLMHNRAAVDPAIDIVADMLAFLSRSIDIALAAGVAEDKLWVDPGFGFGKTPEQNLIAVRRLGALKALGRPVLLGVSRKSTIGRVTGQTVAADRLAGSIAAGLAGVAAGADVLRVHDVAPHIQALKSMAGDRGRPTMSGTNAGAIQRGRIFVDRLRLHAFHGHFAHERKYGQMFEIDLELVVDLVEAAAGDDLKATVDYGKVTAITRQAFCGAPRTLVEAAALDVAPGAAQGVRAHRVGQGAGRQGRAADRRAAQGGRGRDRGRA